METPSVTIRRPRHREILACENDEIVVQVSIKGMNVPQDGQGQVWINGNFAFDMLNNEVSAHVSCPPDPSFQNLFVVLVDPAGNTLGANSSSIQFFYNPPLPAPRTHQAFLPIEHGKVSVIIPSHDRYDSLQDAIESVRSQTYQDIEIIVVNDASLDERYYDLIDDVMLIHLPYNIGRPGLVRNIGIAAATGEWIAFLDDDDVWVSRDKLRLQLEAMARHGTNMTSSEALEGKGAYSEDKGQGGEYRWWLRDAHGAYAVRTAVQNMVGWGNVFDATEAVASGECNAETDCLPDVWDVGVILRANFAITSSVVVRRDALISAGPFNDESLGEDHDMWKVVMRGTPSAFVRRPLVYWRSDGENKMSQSWVK